MGSCQVRWKRHEMVSSMKLETALIVPNQFSSRHLWLYPNGENKETKETIMLYLMMESATSTNFLAKWEVNFLNEAGDVIQVRRYERKGEEFADGRGWGGQFLTHKEFLLQAKDTEAIKIICKVRFICTLPHCLMLNTICHF
jgi:hypothetical protein